MHSTGKYVYQNFNHAVLCNIETVGDIFYDNVIIKYKDVIL